MGYSNTDILIYYQTHNIREEPYFFYPCFSYLEEPGQGLCCCTIPLYIPYYIKEGSLDSCVRLSTYS